jgi:homoserine dehydrogenase
VQVLIEVMGGEHPALELIQRGLAGGQHVVTANKEVVAKHGSDLLRLAAQKAVSFRYEASVGGGIPILGPLQGDLLANDICSLRAIINGTTNYILTRMSREGRDFATALKEAQALGYAEPDPTNDVEGIDAAYKLAILASLGFHTRVAPSQVFQQGIARLQAKDFRYAHELGYEIKLLAIAKKENGAVQARVHPAFVPQDALLAKVDGAYNAVEVEGDLTGRVLFHGLGAGPQPTTSAVLGDLMEVVRSITSGVRLPSPWRQERALPVKAIADLVTPYYLRLNVTDQAGVLAQIAQVLGEEGISIAAVIQKDADPAAGTAEIVVTTHPAREAAVQEALRRIGTLGVVKEVNNLIRMEQS